MHVHGLLESLLFGFAAWGLAIAALKKSNHCSLFVGISFVACCISAVCGFFELRDRVGVRDWSGIEDTINSVIGGIIIMMVVTVVLDLLALAWRDAVAQAEKEAEETA